MRLICPNCDATYEVPENVIPPEGRDVQCSNCGTAWFFQPAIAETLSKALGGGPKPAADTPAERQAADDDLSPEEILDAEAEAEAAAAAEAEAGPPSEPPTPTRRPLDDKVADVFREEAAFEARARAGQSGLEYQDDLPLSAPDPVADKPVEDAPFVEVADEDDERTILAELPPQEAPNEEIYEGSAALSPRETTRRDLLPDIDELNSTLRATSEKAARMAVSEEEAAQLSRRRQGFRTGFGLACMTLAVFAALYSYSGAVAEQVPALEVPLRGYVDLVNDGRVWLETAVGRLAERIEA